MILEQHVGEVCRPGEKGLTCRYLGMGGTGWECLKLDPGLKRLLDDRVEQGTITARGDNCEGRAG